MAKKRQSRSDRIRWLKRFRPPVLFGLLGLALGGATLYASELPRWSAELAVFAGLASRIAFVIGSGWAIGTVVDAIIKRQLSKLNLGAEDNLKARKTATRLDVVRRIWIVIASIVTCAAALVIVPGVQQIGVSLLASAGIAGLALGLAARPVLGNLIAGVQIAFTQPIRLDDAVVIEGEWGWIEEIGLFYVTVKLWDWRRLVIPLSYFIEQPFQNWTRQSASIIGSVFWSLDYRTPVSEIREKLEEICRATELWDGEVVNLQVTDSGAQTITLRALASARTSPRAWDLRCYIREEMIAWLQEAHPESLPRQRYQPADTEQVQPAGPGLPFSADPSLQVEGGAMQSD